MTTEERLEKLEHKLAETESSLHRHRQMLGVGVLVVLGCLTMAAMQNTQVIRAKKFGVVDDQGQDYAQFGMGKDGEPILTMNGDNGKTRIMLSPGPFGPMISLYDKNGMPRAILADSENGPALTLTSEQYGKNFGPRIKLWMDEEGPTVDLSDESGKNRIKLGMSKDKPSMNLFDEDGNPSATLAMSNLFLQAGPMDVNGGTPSTQALLTVNTPGYPPQLVLYKGGKIVGGSTTY